MKKVIIGVFAVMCLALTVVKAEAGLSVLDAANKPVGPGIASASATTPVSGIVAGTAKTVKVSAVISNNLAVALSNTEIAWTINAAGDYKANAIDISLTTNIASDVSMTVAGADDLKSGANVIKTYYTTVDTTSVPATSVFKAASAFNITTKIPVASGVGSTHLWNRVAPAAGLPTGNYTDEFTVTFSQNI